MPHFRHAWAFAFLCAAVFFGATQFSTPHLIAYDGHFHIKYARLMREHGLLLHRDLLPFTILKGEFLDHHFLYHVLLMPFTLLDLRIAGKVAPVVFSSLMTLAFYEVARRQKVPLPLLWVPLLLASSYPFLYRMSMARVMNVGLTLQLILFFLLIRERNRGVFLCSFLYVWLHSSASFVAPLLALLYVTAAFLAERRIKPAALGYALGGWITGFIVNPLFPGNISFAVTTNIHKLLYKSAVQVGKEWYGYKTEFFLQSCTLTFVLMFLGLIIVALMESRVRRDTLFSLFIALLYWTATMKARRFVEYWPPFVLLFCGMSARDYLAASAGNAILSRLKRWRLPCWSLLALMISGSLWWTSIHLVHDLRHSDSNETDRYGPAARWLEDHTRKGETVFNANWDALPEFFFHNSKNAFVAGMDPAFMEMEDPGLFRKYEDITKGRIARPAALIRSLFHTRYILALNGSSKKFLNRLKRDRNARRVFGDGHCSVFEIRDKAASRNSSKPRASGRRRVPFSMFFPAVIPQKK